MTEGKKKTLLKLGIILVAVTVACLAMAGTGAAELKDISNDDGINLTYYSIDHGDFVTEYISQKDFHWFFGTDKIVTFNSADDLNQIAELADTDEKYRHNITYIQTADIDCYGSYMRSIEADVYQFNIYGNGHTITDFTQIGKYAYGLIKRIVSGPLVATTERCVFNGIIMRNCSIKSNSSNVGAIVGEIVANEVVFRGCRLENSTIFSNGGDYIGGLIGYVNAIPGALTITHPSFVTLDNCSVDQCEIMAKKTGNSDSGYTGADNIGGMIGGCYYKTTLIPRNFSETSQITLIRSKVESTKVITEGKYAGGIGGEIMNVNLWDTTEELVNNCIIEAASGKVGGAFGCSRYLTGRDNGSRYYMVKNTAILSGSDYAGVIAGDISAKWSWKISDQWGSSDTVYSNSSSGAPVYRPGQNRVYAENCIVSGTGNVHVTCPGTKADGSRIVDYKKGGTYAVDDSFSMDSISTCSELDLKEHNGNRLSDYKQPKNIDSSFIDAEIKGSDGTSKAVSIVSGISPKKGAAAAGITAAVLGAMGTAGGCGDYSEERVKVEFHITTLDFDSSTGEYVASKDMIHGTAIHGKTISDPGVYIPEGYVQNGWYTDKEMTNKWDFGNDIVEVPLDLYTEIKEKTYTIEYIDHDGGSDKIEVGANDSVVFPGRQDTETEQFLGWNTRADGTGEMFNEGDIYNNKSGDKSIVFYSQWKKKNIFITLTFNMNGHGDMELPQTVEIGELFTRPENPEEEGYTFVDWYSDQACTGAPFDFTIPYNSNQIVYAKWTENTYTIKFNPNGGVGTMNDMTDIRYTEERLLTPNEFKLEHYIFIGWNLTPNPDPSSYYIPTYSDGQRISKLSSQDKDVVTLYAQWVPSSIFLTFNMNGHGDQVPQQMTEFNDSFQDPGNPYKEGFTFGGWYYDSDCKGSLFSFDRKYQTNQTAYAKWTENSYTVKFNGNGADSGSMDDLKLLYTEEVTLPKNAFTRDGHRFIGWNTETDGSGTYHSARDKVSKLCSQDKDVVTLYAQWGAEGKKVEIITLTFDMKSHGDQVASQKTFSFMSFARPADPTEEGYTFVGWETAAGEPFYFSTVYETDQTAYAKWTENTYTVTFDGNGATGGSMDDMTGIRYSESVTLSPNAFTRNSYTFIGWKDQYGTFYDDKAAVSRLTSENNGTVVLSAQWDYKEDVLIYLTFAMNGHGLIQEPVQEVTIGSTFQKPSADPAEPGYTFVGWETAAGTPFDFSTAYETSQTAYAKWTENTYTVTFDGNGATGGSMDDMTGIRYSAPVTLSPNAFTRDSYTFLGWKDQTGFFYEDKALVSGLTLLNNDKITLYAQWEPVEEAKKITLTFDMKSHGDQVASQETVSGTSFARPADPTEEGYTFVRWETAAGEPFDFSTAYETNQTAYAKWTENSYTITFDGNGADSGSMDAVHLRYSESVTLPENVFTRDSYTFIGWKDRYGTFYGDKAAVSRLTSEDNGTVVLSAQWDYKEDVLIYLTFAMNGHGLIQEPVQEVTIGSTFQKPSADPAEPGYTFVGWETAAGTPFDFSTAYETSQTAYAKWTENTYTIKFDGNGATGGSMDDMTGISYSASVTLPENAFTCDSYTFLGWKDQNEFFYEDKALVSGLCSENGGIVTLSAQWEYIEEEPQMVYLSFDMNDHGTQVPTRAVEYGSITTEPTQTVVGFTLEGWYTDRELTQKFDFGKPCTETLTLFANWVPAEIPVYVWDGTAYVNVTDLAGSGLSDCVSYNSGSNTIVLDGYTVNFPDTLNSEEDYGAIYSASSDPLTIVVTGMNTIGTESASITGIYTAGDLTLKGTGTLVMKTDSYVEESYTIGICGNVVTIDGCTLDISTVTSSPLTDGECGIFGLDSVVINSGTVSVTIQNTADKTYGIYGENGISINGGTTTAAGGICGVFTSGEFTMTGGELTVLNAEHGLVASTLVTITGGKTELISNSWALLDGTATEVSPSLNVYAGKSRQESYEVELTEEYTINDLLKEKCPYVWIGTDSPDPEILPPVSVTVSANHNENGTDEGVGYVFPSYLPAVEYGATITVKDNVVIIDDTIKVEAVPEYGYKFNSWEGIPDDGKITGNLSINAIVGESATSSTTVHSSTVTSFTGEKDGNDFTFDKAVVITKATLPGATYATVTNTSGSSWYTCKLSTDGTSGTVYFQVPLDVISVKGWTINDVSMLGCRTAYITSEGGYAKYSAVINGAGSYTIDFEKDAAAEAVEKVQEVVEQKQTATEQKQEAAAEKVQETVEQKQTTQTAAKSPFPVLGILAGLGIAGVLVMRRK